MEHGANQSRGVVTTLDVDVFHPDIAEAVGVADATEEGDVIFLRAMDRQVRDTVVLAVEVLPGKGL